MTSTIEVHGGDYEHVLAVPGIHNGIDIRYVIGRPDEIFVRMLREQAYEACEFSLANFLMLRDRGIDWLRALPIFPYRAFRHATLYVHKDSPLQKPADLFGKRIGVRDFSMTAAVWTRGILSDQYGVRWSDLHWVVRGPQRFAQLPGVALEHFDGELEEALAGGAIDALLATATTDSDRPPAERRFRHLIPDVEAAEWSYYRDFGIYPINHTVVVRADALARLPGLPAALWQAYVEAKAHAYRRKLGATLLPWGASHWQRLFDAFAGDPLPYGLSAANRNVVDRLACYLHDQRLISAIPEVELLFIDPER